MYSYKSGDCDLEPPGYAETQTGTATDASGYTLTATGTSDSEPSSITIRDNNGNQVYPSIADRYGNFWSADASGNLVDDRGQTPVVVSYSGNQIFYDVLRQGGGRARYTVTTVHLTPHTQFNQAPSGSVREYPNGNNEQNLNAVQTLQLPDGSSYQFEYENTFGMMTGVTLPSGGHIVYGWSNYTDSYNNVNRWLTSRTVGSDPSSVFTPSVVSSCGSNQQNCHEKVTVHEPGGDETVYDLQLNNGAWNTNTKRYSGAANGGTQVSSTDTTYDFSNPCGSVCSGSAFVTAQTVTTTLNDGSNLKRTDTYEYANNQLGLVSAKKVYDFYTGNLPAQPMQQTQYTYAGNGIPGDLNEVTVSDGSGNKVSDTKYTYTGTAQATSGLAGHDLSRSLGIYPQTTSDWVSTDGSYVTTNLAMDDAGVLRSESLTAGGVTYGATSYSTDGTDTFGTGSTLPSVNGLALSSGTTPDGTTGLPSSTVDSNAKTTTYSAYDDLNRVGEIDYPNGGFTKFVRTPTTLFTYRARTSNVTATDGTQYDEFGRHSRTASYNGQAPGGEWYVTDTCYNSNGQVSFQAFPYAGPGWNNGKICSGPGTGYSYDALGRATAVTTPDGTTQYSYKGRATRVLDVNGKQTVSQVDGLGRLTAVCEVTSQTVPGGTPQPCGLDIDATGYLTTYAYDDVNHKTTVTQGQQARTFQNDSLGRPTYTSEPERGETTYSYSYNGTGPVTSRTRPRANVGDPSLKTITTTQFDVLNRPVSITYTNNDGSPAAFANNKHFYYDGNTPGGFSASPANARGLLSGTSTDANTRSWYSYDEVGHVKEMRQCAPSICGNATESRPALTFSYDYAGDLTSYFDGASGQISYTRSPAGQLTSVQNLTYTDPLNTPNLVTNIANGPFGPTNWSLGNGTSAVRLYDSMGRVHGAWLCSGNGGLNIPAYCSGNTQIYGYTVNQSGSRVVSTCDTVMNQCQGHGYDDFDRLTYVSDGGSMGAYHYSYDRWGNRLQQGYDSGGPNYSWTYNARNQVSNYTSSIQYDGAGNQTHDDAGHSYIFDPEGKIVSVDGGSTSYAYDALDNRVSDGSTEYMYDPSGRRLSAWNVAANFGGQARIYWEGAQIAWRGYGGATHFQHQNWLGTERLRTDWQGQVIATFQSLASGERQTVGNAGPGGTEDSAGFAGMESDINSGTDHATYRQYSPVEGRWMSPDPYDGSYNLADPQSLNRYSYVNNNPYSFTDPSGLDGPVGSAMGGCIGAIAQGGHNPVSDISCAVQLAINIYKLVGRFAKPEFKGSLEPRPGARGGSAPDPWTETMGSVHLGYPKSYPALGGISGIADALGIGTQQGCEFGECGSAIVGGFQAGVTDPQQTAAIVSGVTICIEAEPCGLVLGTIATAALASSYYNQIVAKRQWNCTASCNDDRGGRRVTGSGSGPNQDIACRAAKKNASQNAGAIVRHCQCSCSQ